MTGTSGVTAPGALVALKLSGPPPGSHRSVGCIITRHKVVATQKNADACVRIHVRARRLGSLRRVPDQDVAVLCCDMLRCDVVCCAVAQVDELDFDIVGHPQCHFKFAVAFPFHRGANGSEPLVGPAVIMPHQHHTTFRAHPKGSWWVMLCCVTAWREHVCVWPRAWFITAGRDGTA